MTDSAAILQEIKENNDQIELLKWSKTFEFAPAKRQDIKLKVIKLERRNRYLLTQV